MSSPSTMPPGKSIPDFASSTPPSSLWDRITTWAANNKAVVYTIAGVAVVVTGAGVAYYLTDSVGCMDVISLGPLRLLRIISTEGHHSWARIAEEVK
jgi:hypothetical protein